MNMPVAQVEALLRVYQGLRDKKDGKILQDTEAALLELWAIKKDKEHNDGKERRLYGRQGE